MSRERNKNVQTPVSILKGSCILFYIAIKQYMLQLVCSSCTFPVCHNFRREIQSDPTVADSSEEDYDESIVVLILSIVICNS